MENSETKGWFKFALDCKYLSLEQYSEFAVQSDEVGKLLNHMMNNPEKYGVV